MVKYLPRYGELLTFDVEPKKMGTMRRYLRNEKLKMYSKDSLNSRKMWEIFYDFKENRKKIEDLSIYL